MQFLMAILVFALNSIAVLLIFQTSGVIWDKTISTNEDLNNKIELETGGTKN